MTTYIIRRLLQALLVLVIVSLIIFLAMRMLPGDPILMYLSKESMSMVSIEEVEFKRHELGLDRPLYEQYADWVINLFHGDLGSSIVRRDKVIDDLKERLPISFHLGILAIISSNIIGILAGVIAAARRGSWIDNIVTAFGNLGVTIPIFWLGILMMYVFGLKLNWLPIFGYTSPFDDFWLSTKQIIMPVFCLSIPPIASAMRLTRSSMLEVMYQDYIRTAWSKGLTERLVIAKHALKNGLIPVVSFQGMAVSQMIGGAVFIETIFSIPGLGRLSVESIFAHDYPVVQGVMLLAALLVVFSNLIVDLSYGWLDPRVRFG